MSLAITCYSGQDEQQTDIAIGKSGLSIVTRLMGLILAVIGAQMLIIGIKSALNLGILSKKNMINQPFHIKDSHAYYR